MIHYHGTPIGGSRQDVARFLNSRHALVPFIRQDDLGAVAESCKSFIFDNSAFSVWKSGKKLDLFGYIEWVWEWCRHPGFSWALIPDVIDGDEKINDAYIDSWKKAGLTLYGVPVWHLHESLQRLERLAKEWPIVAFGSSGQWKTPGSNHWWERMHAALCHICDEHGRPPCKLHGLRMLNPEIFTKIPFSSADSTNAGMNSGNIKRFGMYVPPTAAQRAAVIADRVEAYNSAACWRP